jgi:hypothetical protein
MIVSPAGSMGGEKTAEKYSDMYLAFSSGHVASLPSLFLTFLNCRGLHRLDPFDILAVVFQMSPGCLRSFGPGRTEAFTFRSWVSHQAFLLCFFAFFNRRLASRSCWREVSVFSDAFVLVALFLPSRSSRNSASFPSYHPVSRRFLFGRSLETWAMAASRWVWSSGPVPWERGGGGGSCCLTL